MKYMLLLTRGSWQENGTDSGRERVFSDVSQWWAKQVADGRMVGGHQLHAPHTATTVVIENGKSMLLDRPLIEAKEAIGGYGIIDVVDLDEALAVARSFPVPDGKIEVRAVVER